MDRNKIINKRVYFEIMRVIACGLVIFNHLPGYMLYSTSSGVKQFFYMCLTMLTRINVPLFFMISGALLFQKNEDFMLVLKKRIFRIVRLLVLFDTILIFIQKYLSLTSDVGFSMNIKDFLMGILKNSIPGSGAYWYMYSYLGVLFVLPFLQRIAKGLTKTEVVSLLVLHFVTSSFFPMINIYFVQQNIDMSISICKDFTVPFALTKPFFYTLIGYYLEYNVECQKMRPLQLYLLIISGITGIVLSNVCTYIDAKINNGYSQNYVQLFDYVTAIVVFILIKFLFTVKMPNVNQHNLKKMICFMGSMTLGIYMFDPCFKLLFYEKYNLWAEHMFPTLIVSVGWVLISMTLGTMCTCIIKKIPIIKSIL